MSNSSTVSFTERFRQIGNIPTLPAAATRALAVANDPQCSIRDFCRVIEGDPALATSLLKLVNSAYYSSGNKIGNLTTAVTRLGLRETQNLILAVSVRSVFRWMPREQQAERDRLWRHSGLSAVLTRQLNVRLGLGFSGEEFAAALAHDLGRIMLAIGYPDIFTQLVELGAIDELKLLEEEEKLLGFTHTELGGWLAEMWNLPGEIVEAIRFHHAPEKAPSQGTLAALISMADSMANHLEAEHTIRGLDLQADPGWRFLVTMWGQLKAVDIGSLANLVMAESVASADALVRIKVDEE